MGNARTSLDRVTIARKNRGIASRPRPFVVNENRPAVGNHELEDGPFDGISPRNCLDDRHTDADGWISRFC